MSSPFLSIVIPAYNEERRLGGTLTALTAFLESPDAPRSEVIVVCDGCLDGTESVAGSYRTRLDLLTLSYAPNRGKGYAVRFGVAAASGSRVLFMDADGATDLEAVTRMLHVLDEGVADGVIGSRRRSDAHVPVPQTWRRRILGQLFVTAIRTVLNLPYSDTQCGFKMFEGKAAQALFRGLTCDGFGFDLELLVAARVLGYRIQEIGVHWTDKAGSSVRPVRDGVRMLNTAVRLRRRYRDSARVIERFRAAEQDSDTWQGQAKGMRN